MKQSTLNSLKGLTVAQAKAVYQHTAYKTREVPKGCAITMELKPRTVILWLDENNLVQKATLGNSSELIDDVSEEVE